MTHPEKGDYVTRRSHGCDLIFEVVGIEGADRVFLKGVTSRLCADSPARDLVRVPRGRVEFALAQIGMQASAHLTTVLKKE